MTETATSASAAPLTASAKSIAVIGAGAMGLVAAYHLLKAGHRVTVYEIDDRPGGMAAHFDFEGLSIERFYHFVCKADQPMFDLMAEIGMGEAMRWKDTSMGYFYDGKMHDWGDPISLLKFPGIGLIDKIRYGLHAFTSTKRSDWSKLDDLPADKWIQDWIGQKAYDVLWKKLFELKFYGYSDKISAAWIWTRIKRIGTSRKSLFQEQLGHIEGGSEALVIRLVERITEMGGTLHLSTPVQQIRLSDHPDDQKKIVEGVVTAQGFQPFDAVISTIPIPYVSPMIPDLPTDLRDRYAALPNIGVVCVLHKLRKPVSKHFWVNTNDPRMEIPGLVAFSNLRDTGEDHVVYVPYYMPITEAKFSEPDPVFIAESLSYMRMINPEIGPDDVLASRVGRLKHAQPVCPPGFLKMLPPIAPPEVDGLMVCDTSYYYPEDRGISESARVAKEMAARFGTAGSSDSKPANTA